MFPRLVRHKKRGSLYTVTGPAEGQISKPTMVNAKGVKGRFVTEGDQIIVYQDENGKLWWRFPDEFEDGRFEDVKFERIVKNGDAEEQGGATGPDQGEGST